MKVHQEFALINTFGLNWNKISSVKFIKGSVCLIGGVVDGAEVAFVDKMNLCEKLHQWSSAPEIGCAIAVFFASSTFSLVKVLSG